MPWKVVAKALRKHKALRAATFVSAGLDATQVQALPLASLVELTMGHNPLGDAGARVIADMLSRGKLKRLAIPGFVRRPLGEN